MQAQNEREREKGTNMKAKMANIIDMQQQVDPQVQTKLQEQRRLKDSLKATQSAGKYMKFPVGETMVTFNPMLTKNKYKTWGKGVTDENGNPKTNKEGYVVDENDNMVIDENTGRPFKPKMKWCYFGWQWDSNDTEPDYSQEPREWAVGQEHSDEIDESFAKGYFTFKIKREGTTVNDTRYKVTPVEYLKKASQ